MKEIFFKINKKKFCSIDLLFIFVKQITIKLNLFFMASSVIVSLQQVQDLKVGDFLPNVFGEMKEVVSIHHKGFDVNGKFFACFYQKYSDSSKMSHSIKEGNELFIA